MRLRLSPSVVLMAFLVVALVLLVGTDAFAQTHLNPRNAKNFADVQYNLGATTASVPRLVALVAYLSGTFFAISGLLKMKAWLDDPDRNPLNAFLFRIIVATLLIFMPYVYVITTGTLFGSRADGGMSTNQDSYIKEGGLQPFKKSGQ